MPLKTRNLLSKARRGDTFIEVMFAIAIFSLVAVISIAMMNAGVADAERALELVTARNELNAQAEALRFIHSSYISEATLPTCGSVTSDEKCQQYQALWDAITAHTLRPSDDVTGLNDNYTITYIPLVVKFTRAMIRQLLIKIFSHATTLSLSTPASLLLRATPALVSARPISPRSTLLIVTYSLLRF